MEPQVAAALRVPGYTVGERLGAGGFGEVFRARRDVIDRDVAIKVLHAKYSADRDAVARFIAEARAVNRVSHAGIVEIFDFGQLEDGRHYCVMELIRGRTLRDVLRERTRLPLQEALPILRAIAEAVDAAHAAGIAHRDLKPDNVFIVEDGGVKLIDFGLAKLTTEGDAPVTQTGAVFGTPLYMSPEQCRGKAITVATDRYSFGALAYHVLAGAPPFSGEALELALHHLNDTPAPPSSRCSELPVAVDAAVLALLEKDPAHRPATTVAAVEMMAGERAAPRGSRTRTYAIAAIVLAATIATAVAIVMSRRSSSTQRAWTTRPLRLPIDGTTVNTVLTADATSVIYADQSGWWKHTLATATTVPLVPAPKQGVTARVAPLADGRIVFGDSDGKSSGTIDPLTGEQRELFAANYPAASPDQRMLAGFDAEGFLVVHDLRTRSTRRLTEVRNGRPDCAPKWSPDGQHLLWGRIGHAWDVEHGLANTFLTRVSDGVTRPLSIAFRRETNDYYDPIEFLPDGRLVYCSKPPVEIRTRSVAGGGETVLAKLDDSVSECMFSARGGRIVVTVGYAMPVTAVLDLERPAGQSANLRNMAGPTRLVPSAVDRQFVYAYRDHDHPHDSHVDHGQPGHEAPSLQRVALDTGVATPIASCPDEAAVIRRGDSAVHVAYARNDGSLLLRFHAPGSCKLIDEWRFAGGTRVGTPACGTASCSVLAQHESMVTLWQLIPGRAPLSMYEVTAPDPLSKLVLAVAPDESIAALIGNVVHVRDPGGTTTRIVPPGSSSIDGLAWTAAPHQLLASMQYVDGVQFSLVQLARDGTRTSLWTSKDTWPIRILTDPSGRRVIARTMTWRQEFLLLEQK